MLTAQEAFRLRIAGTTFARIGADHGLSTAEAEGLAILGAEAEFRRRKVPRDQHMPHVDWTALGAKS